MDVGHHRVPSSLLSLPCAEAGATAGLRVAHYEEKVPGGPGRNPGSQDLAASLIFSGALGGVSLRVPSPGQLSPRASE